MNGATCGIHCSLGWAICIVQVRMRQALRKTRRKRRRQRFSAHQHMAHGLAGAQVRLLHSGDCMFWQCI